MAQEEKDLLLRDLCARLPYDVIVQVNLQYGDNGHKEGLYYANIVSISTDGIECDYSDSLDFSKSRDWTFGINDVKPYLRPMSSMTENEKHEVMILWNEDFASKESLYHCYPRTTDFYNRQHLDYRGLIEKGLALKAPEGMYTEDMYSSHQLPKLNTSQFPRRVYYEDTIEDVTYDADTNNVEVLYKSGKKTIHDVDSLKLIESDERELGVEREYLIEPNIHVIFYPESFLSNYYIDN